MTRRTRRLSLLMLSLLTAVNESSASAAAVDTLTSLASQAGSVAPVLTGIGNFIMYGNFSPGANLTQQALQDVANVVGKVVRAEWNNYYTNVKNQLFDNVAQYAPPCAGDGVLCDKGVANVKLNQINTILNNANLVYQAFQNSSYRADRLTVGAALATVISLRVHFLAEQWVLTGAVRGDQKKARKAVVGPKTGDPPCTYATQAVADLDDLNKQFWDFANNNYSITEKKAGCGKGCVRTVGWCWRRNTPSAGPTCHDSRATVTADIDRDKKDMFNKTLGGDQFTLLRTNMSVVVARKLCGG